MEGERSGDVIVELEYESQLTAGLDATRYFLSKSVKESTKTQYDRVYYIWRSFCRDNNIPEFGSDYKPIAACLSLIMIQDESYSKVEMLRAAIANEYRIRMLSSPTTHETISLLFRGFRNEDSHHQRTAKQPITEEILAKMYSHLYQPSNGRDGLRASSVLWRTIWRMSLEYHTLFEIQ